MPTSKTALRLAGPVAAALGAAALFGLSTPFAKQLVGELSPVLLAGLLYLGSGVGLALMRTIRDRGWLLPKMPRSDWLWLVAAIAAGGVAGPVLLMLGLTAASAATASLLLNLEAVFTALLAWVVFGENADRRIVAGMFLIVAGSVWLTWRSPEGSGWIPALIIAGACLCWALDNNLTRKVSASDALFIAGSKGTIAGGVNLTLALMMGSALPPWSTALPAMLIGLLGYGVSLVLFVLALRGLGAARTGAYFSTAPFIGAITAVVIFGEPTSGGFWPAALCMAAGVWLHLTEVHEHEHTHEALLHEHPHIHDEHHRHEHDFPWDGTEPHTHSHQHEPLCHSHAHFPDIHHQHSH